MSMTRSKCDKEDLCRVQAGQAEGTLWESEGEREREGEKDSQRERGRCLCERGKCVNI